MFLVTGYLSAWRVNTECYSDLWKACFISMLSCERAESFLLAWRKPEKHPGGSGAECWFALAGLQNEFAGTNHKYKACLLQKLFIPSFPENKNQGITGKTSSNLQVIVLLAVTSFWYFTCVFCSEINLPSLLGHQSLSWHQTDPALGITAGICSRAGKHLCCWVHEREADLELVFEAPGLRLIGQEVWFELL